MGGRRMSKTLAASVVEGVVVAAIGDITPTDRDWQSFVDVLKAQDAPRLLIHSAGGAPNASRQLDIRYAIGARAVFG